jgi:hypothetical protein
VLRTLDEIILDRLSSEIGKSDRREPLIEAGP